MGRAPRTLLLALLLLGLSPVTASAVDGDGEITFEVPLRADNGLSAELEADDDEIDLRIRKGAQQAFYFPRGGKVSAEGISVKFGQLGEFVVDYQPFRTLKSHEPGPRCEGEPRTRTEGYFRGTLRFQGEGGYVHIEAARAKGTLLLSPPWTCEFGSAGASRAPGEPDPTDEDVATLSAGSGNKSARSGSRRSRRSRKRRPRPFSGLSVKRYGIGAPSSATRSPPPVSTGFASTTAAGQPLSTLRRPTPAPPAMCAGRTAPTAGAATSRCPCSASVAFP